MRTRTHYCILGCIVLLAYQSISIARNSQRIVRVEEDWQLVVETPDPLQDAPQVSTWMSPTNSLSGDYFGVDFNHAQRSNYEGGGYQTKAMNGSTLVEDRLNSAGQNLQHQGETLVWTQALAIENQELVFWIKNGTSTSWGSFGGMDTLIRRSTELSHLNGYDPEVTINSSGVGYASNRVGSLKLLRVRLIDESDQATEIELDRSIE